MKKSVLLCLLALAPTSFADAGCHSGGAVAGGVIGGFGAGILASSLWNRCKRSRCRYDSCNCRRPYRDRCYCHYNHFDGYDYSDECCYNR